MPCSIASRDFDATCSKVALPCAIAFSVWLVIVFFIFSAPFFRASAAVV
jgi:hypothetical protein